MNPKSLLNPGEVGYYEEKTNRIMKVMPGLGDDAWKGRKKFVDPGKPAWTGWKCMPNLPWRDTKEEAEQDLAELAEKKGWERVDG